MLALMVLAFVFLDVIMLVTYTVVVQVVSKDELSAKYVINEENPKDIKGVSFCDVKCKYHTVNFTSLEKHLILVHACTVKKSNAY